jgi:hypothetical protein
MLFQPDLNDAAYLAQIIVSLAGVFILLGVVTWLIHKRQKKIARHLVNSQVSANPIRKETVATYVDLNPLTQSHEEVRLDALTLTYQQWKKERLLSALDNKSTFVRCGVEKSGLRYQITATSQSQALSMLLCAIMAGDDPQASSTFEALFANLLAHPAYGKPRLSSWKNMPDLPRSLKLDPDLHAEAWILFALLLGQRQWADLSRFNYSELIKERSQALLEVWKAIDPETSHHIPDSRYLLSVLDAAQPNLGWKTLQHASLPENDSPFVFDVDEEDPQESINLGLSWLQFGMQALLNDDAKVQDWLRDHKQKIVSETEKLIRGCQAPDSSGQHTQTVTMLSFLAPTFLVLAEKDLAERCWHTLLAANFDKNAGLESTLRLLGLSFLANKVCFGGLDWRSETELQI